MKTAFVSFLALIGPVVGQSPVRDVAPYSYLGCFVDSGTPNTLYQDESNAAGFAQKTVENCVTTCQGLNYLYAGLEYSFQCFCDNSTVVTPTQSAETACNSPCSDAGGEACGSSRQLSVYSLNGVALQAPTPPQTIAGAWTYYGCYTDSASANTLVGSYSPRGGSTAENCAAACAGYQYFGLEYGYECYCSNTIASTATTSNQCNFACTDRRDQRCGGSFLLDIYSAGVVNPTSAASASRASRASAASASSASRASYLSAYSASQVSVASVRSVSSISRASLQSDVSASKAAHSSSLSAARASVYSVSSAHAASLASARSVVSVNNVNHLSSESASRSDARASASSSLSAARASRASAQNEHSASLASARSVRSVLQASATSSRSVASVSHASALSARSASSASVASVRSASSASRAAAAAATQASGGGSQGGSQGGSRLVAKDFSDDETTLRDIEVSVIRPKGVDVDVPATQSEGSEINISASEQEVDANEDVTNSRESRMKGVSKKVKRWAKDLRLKARKQAA